jgi:hypothetical protein
MGVCKYFFYILRFIPFLENPTKKTMKPSFHYIFSGVPAGYCTRQCPDSLPHARGTVVPIYQCSHQYCQKHQYGVQPVICIGSRLVGNLRVPGESFLLAFQKLLLTGRYRFCTKP